MIKIGLIGAGKITQLRHAPEYAENPHCEIVGYYDPQKERAEALVAEFGGKAFDSIEDLLASGVDAVSVCVANVAHASVSIQVLEAGCHVLCEKPMAATLEECEAMNEAATKAGKYLMIGQNQRFNRGHMAAREMIAQGEIGKPLVFETHFGHQGPEGWTGEKNSWFFDKKVAAFGAMADLGVHKTDLIHFLLREPITRVTASLQTVDKKFPDGRPITVDDNAFCIYTTASGVTGTMHVSWTFYGEENNSTIIYGSKGIMRLYDDEKYALIIERPDGTKVFHELDQMASNKEQNTGGRTNTGVIDAFIESIRTQTPPSISGEEAIKAMRVIFAAEESHKQEKTLDVTHPIGGV